MRALFGAALFSFGLVTVATAADLSPIYKAPPSLAARAYNWTGYYAGVHVGHLKGSTTNDTNGTLPDSDGKSYFAGLQAGYRHQFDNNVVLGLQVSAPLLSKKQNVNIFGNLNHVKMHYAVLGQLQLGYAIGRFLPYVTGGIGAARVEAWEVAGAVESTHVYNTHALYAAGVGVNYGVTDHLSLGVEYNHTWTNRKPYNCGPAVCAVVGSFDFHSDSFAMTANYKF